MQKPLILLTNDDGYAAKGINVLVPMLKQLGDVVMVAPSTPQSGQSGSITVKEPLRFSKFKKEEGFTAYHCSGTPVDSVKIAINQILDRKPDLVISGINHGINSSISIHYSGTMGAALEGAIHGIPSIGLSLNEYIADADFTEAVKWSKTIIEDTLNRGLPSGSCLNVNFPKGTNYNGIKVCKQAHGKWVEEFEERTDPHGGKYYWLTGHYEDYEPNCKTSDEWAIKNHFVAVVPCTIDLTHYAFMNELEKRYHV